MGKLRTRVGLGAAVVGIGLALSAPAFADGARFQITSPQTGATISNTPTVKGVGEPGARVAVEAINQRNNDNHWNNGNGRPGDNGNQPGSNGNGRPGDNGNQPGNNGPGSNGPGSNGPGSNGPGSNGPGNNGATTGPGNNGPANNGNWNNGSNQPENNNAVAGRCSTNVDQNGFWSCRISPTLRPGTYRVIARQTMPGGGNEVSTVDNLMVAGGQLPVTPGPDPVPVVAGGLVLLAGGALVVGATRTRRRGKHAA